MVKFLFIGFLVSGSMATLLVFLTGEKMTVGIVMTLPIILLSTVVFRLYLQTKESHSIE